MFIQVTRYRVLVPAGGPTEWRLVCCVGLRGVQAGQQFNGVREGLDVEDPPSGRAIPNVGALVTLVAYSQKGGTALIPAPVIKPRTTESPPHNLTVPPHAIHASTAPTNPRSSEAVFVHAPANALPLSIRATCDRPRNARVPVRRERVPPSGAREKPSAAFLGPHILTL